MPDPAQTAGKEGPALLADKGNSKTDERWPGQGDPPAFVVEGVH